ncbi:MAG: hypothetical protein HY304_00520 [candidate division Zixibacteria bacterium]|nr:hypothetical protein [candidate division Zixibacteria bacterium]
MTGRLLLIVPAAWLTISACQGNAPGKQSAKPTGGALIIGYRPDSADTFASRAGDSLTALAWLERAADSAGIAVTRRTFPFGILVESIGPRHNGQGGYWLYKVNGQMIPESSHGHRVAPTDTVEFFFDER